MAVRYIEVTAISKLFNPATRSFGDVAIVGTTDSDAAGPMKTPVPITNPDNLTYSAKTVLSSAVNAAVVAIPVASTVGFPSIAPFSVRIEDETLLVTTVNANNTWTVTRGQAGTTAAAHANGTAVGYATKDKAVDDTSWFKGALARSVRTAFAQTPGPMLVWAIRVNPAEGANALANALAEVAKLDVQIVILSNTPLVSPTVGQTEIELLSTHVDTVSKTGSDGKERIGVAMLGNGASPTVITAKMSSARMVMVAHKSTEDAAAAVAGTIAGYEPHISLLLKQVSLGMDQLFSDAEIDAFNTARVNWLTDPSLLPGKGLFMGEGYTLGTDMPYIDIVRTIDDTSFRLKAQLIRSIGDLRISRSGLRTLVSQMTAVLEPLKQREVIDSYVVFLPLLVLLDKDPASLTDVELQQIHNVRASRTVDAIVTVEYAGAIHRLNISLIFQ
jgi:hypothetical protein